MSHRPRCRQADCTGGAPCHGRAALWWSSTTVSRRTRVGRFLVYHSVRLWEKFYPEFIASDLEALLRQTGVEVTHKAPVLLGTARILRGRKDTRAVG